MLSSSYPDSFDLVYTLSIAIAACGSVQIVLDAILPPTPSRTPFALEPWRNGEAPKGMGALTLPPELAPLAAALQLSTGLAPEAPRYPRVGERKVPGKCRVIGCTTDLRRQTASNVKNRLCQAHWSASVLEFRGVLNRFCSKCTRLRSLPEFEGEKRTCRKCLLSHTARRRAREAGASGADRNQTDHAAEGRSTSPSEEDGIPRSQGAAEAFDGGGPVPPFPPAAGAGPELADVLAAAMAEAAKAAAITEAQPFGGGPGGAGPAAPALAASPATVRRLVAAIRVEKLNMELAQAQQDLAQAQLEETLSTLQGGAPGTSIPEQLLATIQSLFRGQNT